MNAVPNTEDSEAILPLFIYGTSVQTVVETMYPVRSLANLRDPAFSSIQSLAEVS